jgi:UDP-N-acetylglucosamine diphosphorylase/glucosamine-1-phosphate N-acetyltransferase
MASNISTYVFDDARADSFAPFALTRPAGEMLYGRWTARERLERSGLKVVGHVTRPWLASYTEPGTPGVVSPADITATGVRLFWSSRAIAGLPEIPAAPSNFWIAGSLAGVSIPTGSDTPDASWFAGPAPLDGAVDVEVDGEWLMESWDLVARGPDRLRRDLEILCAGEVDATPPGVHRLGDAPLLLGPGAMIEPGVLVDTRGGPVVLGAGVEVRAGARIAGPVYAGDHSRLLGGAISVLSAGPFSSLRGEIEEVIAFGYGNKAHDGFLGHAVIGTWVNLGALTTNSDLKNNYGTVRVGPPGAVIDTGLTKLGCLIGDHVKTGIGCLLNTGTVVGAGSNIFGSQLPPKWIPPFSWGQGSELTEYRREAFLATAATVLPRRGVAADETTLAWLGDVWDAARG